MHVSIMNCSVKSGYDLLIYRSAIYNEGKKNETRKLKETDGTCTVYNRSLDNIVLINQCGQLYLHERCTVD